jgi:TonB family protein
MESGESALLIAGDDRLLDGPSGPPGRLRSPVDPDDTLRRHLKHSGLLHLTLLLFVTVKGLVFPDKPKPYLPALRVDLVGLPDILKKDLADIPPLPPSASKPAAEPDSDSAKSRPEPETADPDEMVLKKTRPQDITRRNRDRLKQLELESRRESERKKKMDAAVERMKSLAKITEGEQGEDPKPGVLIKGNQISRGTSLSGDAREGAEPSYYDSVKARLQQHWELPVWLKRQELSARVEIFIDSRGMIRSYRFTQPSGNAQFDEAVKRTLQVSQPFPAPPKTQAATILLYGISVGFPL